MAKGVKFLQDQKVFDLFLRKTATFMAWLIVVSLIFIFFSLLSPNPPSMVTSYHKLIFGKIALPPNAPIVHGEIKKEEEEECDLSEGRWVRDYGGTPYTNTTCRTLPEADNCWKYGKDHDYVNWRWRPSQCELPRFDGAKFLEIVRGKTMAFAGDSVARNQMESLLCLLSQIETPVDLESDGENRFRKWYFQSQNFTLMALWTEFLVVAPPRLINGSLSGVFDLHLDKVDTNWANKLPGINYLIISSGHWFFRQLYLHENGHIVGCVFCSEANTTSVGISFAVRKALRTALEYVDHGCKECQQRAGAGLFTILRTFTGTHFEHGEWNTGGHCSRSRPLEGWEVEMEAGYDWEVAVAQKEELERMIMRERASGGRGERRKGGRSSKSIRYEIMDVSKAMMMRPDAHPNSHFNNEWNRVYRDCVHWCLPGPIDMWNDILLTILKRSGRSDQM